MTRGTTKKSSSDLMARMKQLGALKPESKKPSGLSFDEIVLHTEEFILSQSRYRIDNAFGNMVGPDLESPEDEKFDPLALYKNDPTDIDDISMYVQFDMNRRESELVKLSDKNEFYYNMVIFGAALKIANSEDLSENLRTSLVKHLIDGPRLFKNARGRPSASRDNKVFAIEAIRYAHSFGLHVSRNDASPPRSACDAVEFAADNLIKSGKLKEFPLEYTFKNLIGLWNKRKTI